MNAAQVLWIAIGGAAGSVARAWISLAFPAARFAWGTLLINVAGSFLIGWLIGRLGGPSTDHARLHGLLITGFCGGFTTFSAFSWQVLDAFQKNQPGSAVALVLASVIFCLAATWIGWRLAQ